MKIVIDNECYDVRKVHNYGYLPEVDCGEATFIVAKSSQAAGKKAKAYWKDLAENDPREFSSLVGEKTLVAWGRGEYAGPGYSQVNSLKKWLNLWKDTPEEQWASYDSTERDVTPYRDLCEKDPDNHPEEGDENSDAELEKELGFIPTVAYRHN